MAARESNGHAPAPLAPKATDQVQPLQSFPGPCAHGKQTKVTMYSRAQLIDSGLLAPLEILINQSFSSQRNNGILQGHRRLRREDQLLEELGHAPDTFLYIVSTSHDPSDGASEHARDELIATAYASRYEGVAEWPEGPGERTWQRLGVVDEGERAWELHLLAVSPRYQSQGLAKHLMTLVEAEIVRREEVAGAVAAGKQLVLFITTIKQTNEAFYLRRGFVEKYSIDWPAGHIESPKPWTVVHMDRPIPLKTVETV